MASEEGLGNDCKEYDSPYAGDISDLDERREAIERICDIPVWDTREPAFGKIGVRYPYDGLEEPSEAAEEGKSSPPPSGMKQLVKLFRNLDVEKATEILKVE